MSLLDDPRFQDIAHNLGCDPRKVSSDDVRWLLTEISKLECKEESMITPQQSRDLRRLRELRDVLRSEDPVGLLEDPHYSAVYTSPEAAALLIKLLSGE